MKYVVGITKRFSYTKSENHTKNGRKHYFCYEFDVESGKFKRVRISTIKAIYYKITFIFGLNSRMVGRPIKPNRKQGTIYCEDCGKYHFSLVNFWNQDISCPYC